MPSLISSEQVEKTHSEGGESLNFQPYTFNRFSHQFGFGRRAPWRAEQGAFFATYRFNWPQ